MTTRRFSLQEANALLPQLEVLVERLAKKKEEHDRLHDRLFFQELIDEATRTQLPAVDSHSNQDGTAQEVDSKVSELEKELIQIRLLGCILRSLENGWVEFPGEHEGQIVFFCWKRGEKTVRYFRHFHSHLSERLPL